MPSKYANFTIYAYGLKWLDFIKDYYRQSHGFELDHKQAVWAAVYHRPGAHEYVETAFVRGKHDLGWTKSFHIPREWYQQLKHQYWVHEKDYMGDFKLYCTSVVVCYAKYCAALSKTGMGPVAYYNRRPLDKIILKRSDGTTVPS